MPDTAAPCRPTRKPDSRATPLCRIRRHRVALRASQARGRPRYAGYGGTVSPCAHYRLEGDAALTDTAVPGCPARITGPRPTPRCRIRQHRVARPRRQRNSDDTIATQQSTSLAIVERKYLQQSQLLFWLLFLTTPFASALLIELFSSHLKPGQYTKLSLLVGSLYPAIGSATATYFLCKSNFVPKKTLSVPLILFLPPIAKLISCTNPSFQALQPYLLPLVFAPSLLSETLRRVAIQLNQPDSAMIYLAHHLFTMLVAIEPTPSNLTAWWSLTISTHLFFWWETTPHEINPNRSATHPQ